VAAVKNSVAVGETVGDVKAACQKSLSQIWSSQSHEFGCNCDGCYLEGSAISLSLVGVQIVHNLPKGAIVC
jgi:hypothetical protein